MASQHAEAVISAIQRGHLTGDTVSLQQAAAYFEELKRGEIHASTEIAATLIGPGGPAEVQHFGYAVMQHLVGTRWHEFSGNEHQQLATLAYDMLFKVGQGQDLWSVKSKAAVLLALVVKRSGQQLWQALQPRLLLQAQQGALQAELVCMVLRFVAEEVMVFADDMRQDSKRALLAGLMVSLPTVLPELRSQLERHFGAVLSTSQAGQTDLATAHAAAVAACLGAVEAYMGWAPLAQMQATGLLRACSYLLTTNDFRMAAVDILAVAAARKQQQESLEDYKAAQNEVGQALTSAAAAVLAPAAASGLTHGGANNEFALRLGGCMAEWGAKHIHTLSQDQRTSFLAQMLTLVQQPHLHLSASVLPFWISLLQQPGGKQDNSAVARAPIPEDAAAALLNTAGDRLRLGVHLDEDADELPDEFDTFAEQVEFCVDYRGKQAQIVKAIATWLPIQVLQSASSRMAVGLAACAPGSTLDIRAQTEALDRAVYFMECAAAATATFLNVPHDASPAKLASQSAVAAAMEPLVSAILQQPPLHNAAMLIMQARSLEALAAVINARPQTATPVLHKVFELVSTAIPLGEPARGVPPEEPTPQWKSEFSARQKAAGVLVALGKSCSAALCPYLPAAAQQVQALWDGDRLRVGEYAVLSEGLVSAAAAGNDTQLQSQVLQWVLTHIQTVWGGSELAVRLSAPAAFYERYISLQPGPDHSVRVGGRKPRQDVYHELHMVERSLRRFTPPAPALVPPGEVPTTGSAAPQPPSPAALSVVVPHLEWCIPFVLQFTRGLHSMWLPEVRHGQLAPAAPALELGSKERTVYLGQRLSRNIKVEGDEEGEATLAGSSLPSLRNWLRQARELSYQILGLAVRLKPEALPGAADQWVAALSGSLSDMSSQHLRLMLRHVIIPAMQLTPLASRGAILLPVLHVLLPHVQIRLQQAWADLMSPNTAAAADAGGGIRAAGGASDEVVAERLLRELTREHLLLLSQLQGRDALPPGSPAGTEGPTALEWLLRADAEAGWAAVSTAAAAMTWPDEAVGRANGICRLVVQLLADKGPLADWPLQQQLAEWAGRQVAMSAVVALAGSSSASHQADILGTLRLLLLQPMAGRPGLQQELMSLLKVSAADLATFHAELAVLNSEREQRSHIKKFLLASGIEELQKSLGGTGIVAPSVPLPQRPQSARSTPSLDETGAPLGIHW